MLNTACTTWGPHEYARLNIPTLITYLQDIATWLPALLKIALSRISFYCLQNILTRIDIFRQKEK